MISVRVNEIFNYLSSDHKKEQCKKLVSLSSSDSQQAGNADSVQTSVCGDRCCAVESSVSTTTKQRDVVLRKCANVQDKVPSLCYAESTGVQGDCHDPEQLLTTTANTKTATVEQHNQHLLQKNCDKDATDARNSSRQKTRLKPEEEKWTVVSKDGKHDHSANSERHTVVEAEVNPQSKSRKKRNRRNRDRTGSAVTLDFRSTSCSAVREDDGSCPKNRISETKSFHTSDKVTGKEKPASGVCKQLGHAKSDTFSCRSSAGDSGRDAVTRPVVKDESKPPSTAKRCPALCNVTLDNCMVSKAKISSTILDANKIDALDSFDDLLPAAATNSRPDVDDCLSQQPAADGEQWTAVNRRCKKVIMSSVGVGSKLTQLDSIADVTGAHIDVERHDEKVVVIIRGSSEQISSAVRLVTEFANSIESEQAKKRSVQSRGGHGSGRAKNHAAGTNNRVADNRGSKTVMTGTLPTESNNCHPPLPSADDSSGNADECHYKLEPTASMLNSQQFGPVGSNRVPSVREYSLFDNHFSKAVESVLKNDIGVSGARKAFVGAPCTTASYPTVDEALLAKAPGYRASTASPCGGRYLAERLRKYSNDSSSSLSSVKSCEDSPSSVNGILPPSHRPRTCHLICNPAFVGAPCTTASYPTVDEALLAKAPGITPDVPLSCPFHSVHDLPPKIPSCVPSPFSEFRCAAEATSEPLDSEVTPATVHPSYTVSVSEHYSSPNEPMTLPRISTDLNPNAPDFVFRQTAQVPHVDGHISSSPSIHPDVPVLTAAASDSFFMMASTSGGWSEQVVGMTAGETLATTTTFDISVPEMSLDMTSRQWTVPSTLLQESLTFG